MRIRSLPSTIGILLLLPLPGCCSLARFFCGPDRTEWVSVDRSTPTLAVKTMLEALRRSDPDVLYLTLSTRYCEQHGLTQLTASLMWEQFCAANPGLHVAGYAQVPPPTKLTDDRAEFTLDVEGRTVEVSVVRELRWRATFLRDDGLLADKGGPLRSFDDVATIAAEKDAQGVPKERSRLIIDRLVVPHTGMDAVPMSRIASAGIDSVWRIDDIRMPEAP